MSARPHKAIVLAAGLGTRLRPFTASVPKPLLPVWGEPILSRIVAELRERGVDDIVVNCHYFHEQVEAWCAANGCRASYEPEILGTGGVLNPLRDWIGSDDFYLVNGDIVVDHIPDLASSLISYHSSLISSLIGVCAVATIGPRTIELEPEGHLVTCWKSPDPGWDGTWTYAGFALLKAEILAYVEPTGFSTIVQAYERAMMDGKFIRGVPDADFLWTDAGTVDSYIELNRSGEDNAFADLPQLKAAGLADPIEFLGARGSDRAFFRSGGKIAIVYEDAKRGENAKYAGHARWLKERGVKVPEVIADVPAMKTLVLENAGSEDLLARLGRRGVDRIGTMTRVIEELAKFNALDPAGLDLEPAFDAELYKWERGLFAEHCLGTRFHLEMTDAVRAELEAVAEKLLAEPPALVHRDFQSTNVIWKNDDFKFIDFQGMRRGAAAYDLASLLYDPYVTFSDKEREALAAYYAKVSGRPEIVKILPFAAVERLVQALGAYGRLASVGHPEFSKHVLPALGNLLSAADEAGLDAVGALAEDLIAKESPRK